MTKHTASKYSGTISAKWVQLQQPHPMIVWLVLGLFFISPIAGITAAAEACRITIAEKAKVV
jgi:hypothetical protein